MHQNRSKRQKHDVNYFELNIGKSTPQPKLRGKLKTKKIDIVAAVREPSEMRLAAYQMQNDCQNSYLGDVIGTAIKTEIKSEIKIELERVNTRHKYKNCKFPEHPNYIHVDGTPCGSARKKANKLPDLPQVDDTPQSTSANGLAVETSPQTDTNTTSASTGPDQPQNVDTSNDTNADGLPVETSTQKDTTKSPRTTGQLKTNKSSNAEEKNHHDGLTVETIPTHNVITSEQTETNHETSKVQELQRETPESNKGLLVETTENITENEQIPNKDGLYVETNNGPTVTSPNTGLSPDKLSNNSVREDQNGKESKESTVSEAALGLIMLHEHDTSDNDALLEKYDNSSILPVDAAREMDYSIELLVNTVDNSNNTSYDSDDTIILQQEIEDTIGKTTENSNNNTTSSSNTCQESGLPVEMTEKDITSDTSGITTGLSKLTVSQIPVSPNKGTVVFKSDRLRCHTTDTDKETSSSNSSTREGTTNTP